MFSCSDTVDRPPLAPREDFCVLTLCKSLQSLALAPPGGHHDVDTWGMAGGHGRIWLRDQEQEEEKEEEQEEEQEDVYQEWRQEAREMEWTGVRRGE